MVGPFTAMWYQGLQGTCLILVKFVPAVAYHLCLNLPATFSQQSTSHKQAPTTVLFCHFVLKHKTGIRYNPVGYNTIRHKKEQESIITFK